MVNIVDITVKSLFFIGDIHGNLGSVRNFVKQYDIKDSCLIFCGDCGFGFEKHEYYRQAFNKLSRVLSKNNDYVMFIRGNHDDPAIFNNAVFNYKRIKTVPDYTVIRAYTDDEKTVLANTVLCVGGAISIDRLYRLQVLEQNAFQYRKYHGGTLEEALVRCRQVYWTGEPCEYREDKLDVIMAKGLRIQTVATHTSPSFCQPTGMTGIQRWLDADDGLSEDITDERRTMDKLYEKLRHDGHPLERWCYGHFHFHNFEDIDGVKFCLLDMAHGNVLDAVEVRLDNNS